MFRKGLGFLIKFSAALIFLSIVSVIIFRFIPIPVTPLMVIRCAEQISDGKELKLKKSWISLKEMGPVMPLAVIASEDQNFEEHFGFDFKAIKKAGTYNSKHHGKKKKGASTISQQTAKNVFLWPSRSWIRKGFEVYFTFLIELFWSKKRIIEVYLNVIEMGDGIYGIEKASQTYFQKETRKLSIIQAARIAAILPNPRVWDPVHPSRRIVKKSQNIVYFMGRIKSINF